jgi:hypothetical protein
MTAEEAANVAAAQRASQKKSSNVLSQIVDAVSGSNSSWSNLFNVISAGAQVYSAYQQIQIAKDAAKQMTSASRLSTSLQQQSRAEESAMNMAQAASERRQQLREERVRRGKLIQSGVNTGVSGSSGEAGALGGLSTTLGSNLGFNLGARQAADNISNLNQEATNVIGEANANYRESQNEMNMWGALGQFSTSIFSGTGGFNTLFNRLPSKGK